MWAECLPGFVVFIHNHKEELFGSCATLEELGHRIAQTELCRTVVAQEKL